MKFAVVTINDTPALLPHYVNHYLALGVDRFLVHVHDDAGDSELVEACRDALRGVDHVLATSDAGRLPISDMLNRPARNQLTGEHCGPGDWVLQADLDEFCEFGKPLDELIRECESLGVGFVLGEVVDRFAADGALRRVAAAPSVFEQYPRVHPFTRDVMHADPVKIFLMRGDLALDSLHPRFDRDLRPRVLNGELRLHPTEWARVHHFKWHARVVPRLQRRYAQVRREHERTGEAGYLFYLESLRALTWLVAHQYRVDIDALSAEAASGLDDPPRVAVVTPCVGAADELVEAARDSVRRQTLRATHVLVGDAPAGGPDDGAVRLQTADMTADAARARGGAWAFGEGFDGVTFLDAGNRFEPDHVASLVRLQRDVGAAICTSGRVLVGADGTPLGRCLESSAYDHQDCCNALYLTCAAADLVDAWAPSDGEPEADGMDARGTGAGERRVWRRALSLPHGHTHRFSVRVRTDDPEHFRRYGRAVPPRLLAQ